MGPQGNRIEEWVETVVASCSPKEVYWCDGSAREYRELCETLVEQGTFIRLNPEKRPNSFLARSAPDDVARLEHRTFICTATRAEAGPTNNWEEPEAMRGRLAELFEGAMAGRIMYVIPFVMANRTPIEMFGIQITDSAYVAASMHLMSCVGSDVLERMPDDDFVRCMHSVGAPLMHNETSTSWPCNAEKYIAHFPQDNEIISFGSGYGGNALLGKKCLALRLASARAHSDGWLAEHMLVVGLESPEGEKSYVAGAFPSACGKTNFAMVRPPEDMKDWTITTVGDDIAWLFRGRDGDLRAVNPEAGFFGVAPGTSADTNQVAIKMVARDTIFTNCALTDDGDVWWEGLTSDPPAHLTDWQGQPWEPGCGRPAAHPNARFTVPATNCGTLDPAWNAPEGVPISALVFGARLSRTFPLVFQAYDWTDGVLWAATLSSEATAAAEGQAALRRDPFAMLPFCGYAMPHYWQHWLQMKERFVGEVPIFRVNWFRRNQDGKFIWPGFRENARILRWIVDRSHGRIKARDVSIGYAPREEDIHGLGQAVTKAEFDEVMSIDPDAMQAELSAQAEYLVSMGADVPEALSRRRDSLEAQLQKFSRRAE